MAHGWVLIAQRTDQKPGRFSIGEIRQGAHGPPALVGLRVRETQFQCPQGTPPKPSQAANGLLGAVLILAG
jgi:hypothetical protein